MSCAVIKLPGGRGDPPAALVSCHCAYGASPPRLHVVPSLLFFNSTTGLVVVG